MTRKERGRNKRTSSFQSLKNLSTSVYLSQDYIASAVVKFELMFEEIIKDLCRYDKKKYFDTNIMDIRNVSKEPLKFAIK